MKRVYLLLKSYDWWIILSLSILTVGLGWCGFSLIWRAPNDVYTMLDNLYLSLQLFVLQPGDHGPDLPWQLQLARLAAPTLVAWGSIKAMRLILRDQLLMFRLQRFKDHFVICGSANSAIVLAEGLLNQKKKVVLVMSEEETADISEIAEKGAIIVKGNMLDADTLKKAVVETCSHLIIMSPDDITNISTAIHALNLSVNRSKNPLQCYVHLLDKKFEEILRKSTTSVAASTGAKNEKQSVEMHIFNVYENSAKTLFRKHALFENQDIVSDNAEHIKLLIIGFGNTGEHILLYSALNAHFANSKQISITILDKDATNKVAIFLRRFPGVQRTCNIAAEDVDILSIDLASRNIHKNFTYIVICFDNDTLNLSTAMHILDGCPKPCTIEGGIEMPLLAIRISKSSNVAKWVDANSDSFSNIACFGSVEEIASPDVIINKSLDYIAKVNHLVYSRVYDNIENGQDMAIETLANNMKTYTQVDLSETELKWNLTGMDIFKQDSNRAQAEHMNVKLYSIGLTAKLAVELLSEEAHRIVTAEQAMMLLLEKQEDLSRVEHERWNAFHFVNGWEVVPADRFPKGKNKDTDNKKHICLVSWDGLDFVSQTRRTVEGNKAIDYKIFDRAHVLSIPYVLNNAGYAIYRIKG